MSKLTKKEIKKRKRYRKKIKKEKTGSRGGFGPWIDNQLKQ